MEMAMTLSLITCLSISLYFHCSYSLRSRPPIGVHPLDFNYYDADLIKCKDGSKSFSRERLNDNFCDCADGTDEPGTSACPSGRFYCKNVGSTPRFLFSSRVNDQICDCCDGSDEYDGTAICPNTCIMGGTIIYQGTKFESTGTDLSNDVIKTKPGAEMEGSMYKLIGLKTLVFLQVAAFVIFVVPYLFRRRKTRRRILDHNFANCHSYTLHLV